MPHAKILTDLILGRVLAGHNSCFEFMHVAVLTRPEDIVLFWACGHSDYGLIDRFTVLVPVE